jgi:hypothetical protein
VPQAGWAVTAARPVDRVVAGHVGDPAGDQPQRQERARQERQRQHDDARHADDRLALAGQQREGIGQPGHGQREQHRDADQGAGAAGAAGEGRAGAPADRDDHGRLHDGGDRLVAQHGRGQGAAADRRGEEPVQDAGLHVLDIGHTGPARGEHGGHDDDAGGQVGDVAAAAEPRYLRHLLEQGAEQQQPDDGLEQAHEDDRRLAAELAQVAGGQDGPGLPDEAHDTVIPSAARNDRPA